MERMIPLSTILKTLKDGEGVTTSYRVLMFAAQVIGIDPNKLMELAGLTPENVAYVQEDENRRIYEHVLAQKYEADARACFPEGEIPTAAEISRALAKNEGYVDAYWETIKQLGNKN